MSTQIFDLGTILSITSGKLLTDLDNVYKILDFMTTDNLFTHQLPRVAKECTPYLLEKFPFLKEITTDHINQNNWKAELEKLEEKYGNSFSIHPIHSEDHEVIDPATEALIMNPDMGIIHADETLSINDINDMLHED